jgi:hypothetical protein
MLELHCKKERLEGFCAAKMDEFDLSGEVSLARHKRDKRIQHEVGIRNPPVKLSGLIMYWPVHTRGK